jgi:tRNA A37 threonylcarbamoyladenosine modification protein TsaB
MSAQGPLVLAIETSNPSAVGRAGVDGAIGPGVAIGRQSGAGVEVLHAEALRAVGRHEDDLATCIDRCVRAVVGDGPVAIGRVVVSVGPGGYTALRMACAAAQMIALVHGARCVAVPTAGALAMSHVMGMGGAGMPLGVALAGKGETAHVTVFSEPARVREPGVCGAGMVLSAAEVAALGLETLIADEHVPEPLVRMSGARVVVPRFDPRALLEIAGSASSGWGEVDASALVPRYAREPEAVTLWRARGGAVGGGESGASA